MNENVDNSHSKALCHEAQFNIVTNRRIVAYSHTSFCFDNPFSFGVKVHLLQFCSSNYILKWKLPGHRKSIRKVKRTSWTALDVIHNSAKHWAITTTSEFQFPRLSDFLCFSNKSIPLCHLVAIKDLYIILSHTCKSLTFGQVNLDIYIGKTYPSFLKWLS